MPAPARNSREPPRPRSADGPEQNRLGLVVRVMRGDHQRGPDGASSLFEEGIARRARLGLGGERCASFPQPCLDSPAAGEPRDPLGVLAAPLTHAVVEVGDDELGTGRRDEAQEVEEHH